MKRAVVNGGEGGVVAGSASMVLVLDLGKRGTHEVEVNALADTLIVLENGAVVLEPRAAVVANQLAQTRKEKLPRRVENVDR